MRKRKNGFKKISIKTIILIILTIFLLTISVGYSYLQQRLSMVGKSTISKSNGSGQIINGESTYTWTLINSWGGGGSSYIYQIKIEIFNKDEAIEKWRLSFDVPNSYDHASSNIWIAESSSYENGRVILNAHGWNASIPTGGSVSLEFQLAFKEEVIDLISNLELVDSTKISEEETENTTPETEGETGSEEGGTTVPDSGEIEGTTGTEENGETTPDSGETEETTEIEENSGTTSDPGKIEETTDTKGNGGTTSDSEEIEETTKIEETGETTPESEETQDTTSSEQTDTPVSE